MWDFFFAVWSNVGDIMLNAAIGIATGVFSGLAVARASRFSQIKQQLHRQMRNWEYMENGNSYQIRKSVDCQAMFDAASELAYLGHPTACIYVKRAERELRALQQARPLEGCTIRMIGDLDQRLQEGFRELSPTWRAIILNGRL